MQQLEPLGIERWPVELALKFGMRDGLTCPIGGRWVIAYWSSQVLSQNFSDEVRAILFMGATFAAIRLQKNYWHPDQPNWWTQITHAT